MKKRKSYGLYNPKPNWRYRYADNSFKPSYPPPSADLSL